MLVGELLDRGGGDARHADPVGAHPDRLLGALLVEVARAERLRVARAELEDVADLDRRLDRDRVAADEVAGLDGCARRPRSKAKSRPGSTPRRCVSGAVGADHVGPRRRRPRRAAPARCAPTGPMKPGRARSARSISSARRRRATAPRARSPSLISLTRWSPRTITSTRPRPSATTGNAFSSRARGDARAVRRRRRSCVAPGRRAPPPAPSQRRRQLDRLRLRRCAISTLAA